MKTVFNALNFNSWVGEPKLPFGLYRNSIAKIWGKIKVFGLRCCISPQRFFFTNRLWPLSNVYSCRGYCKREEAKPTSLFSPLKLHTGSHFNETLASRICGSWCQRQVESSVRKDFILCCFGGGDGCWQKALPVHPCGQCTPWPRALKLEQAPPLPQPSASPRSGHFPTAVPELFPLPYSHIVTVHCQKKRGVSTTLKGC